MMAFRLELNIPAVSYADDSCKRVGHWVVECVAMRLHLSIRAGCAHADYTSDHSAYPPRNAIKYKISQITLTTHLV